jgi:hypothetical protein
VVADDLKKTLKGIMPLTREEKEALDNTNYVGTQRWPGLAWPGAACWGASAERPVPPVLPVLPVPHSPGTL